MYRRGSPVIYRMTKRTGCPGPRAREIQPDPLGECYSYIVEKFWSVAAVREDGQLVLVTRRGKEHVVVPDDPRLREPAWWERLMYHRRFPRVAN